MVIQVDILKATGRTHSLDRRTMSSRKASFQIDVNTAVFADMKDWLKYPRYDRTTRALARTLLSAAIAL